MAYLSSFPVLFFMFIIGGVAVSATEGNCPYTVWQGSNAGNTYDDGGFQLNPGASVQITAPSEWSGRIWARTGCDFDSSGHGNCVTGDCGVVSTCAGSGGDSPVTMAELTLGEKDSYDVRLVDGYNVKLGIEPVGGYGDCKYAGCVSDLNAVCPNELQVMDSDNNVVACKNPCAAFKMDKYCCTGAYSKPQACSPTQYSAIFGSACPSAYSYAYEQASSTITCSGENYLITFCPTNGGTAGPSAEFTLQNNCPYTVWPGIFSSDGNTNLGDGGFQLIPGASVQLTAPSGWSGRIWARTGCNFNSSGQGNCVTGDCGGVLKCAGAGGVPPVTLAEFTIGVKDFYDVSLVDGYNVKIGIKPQGGTGDCKYAGCSSDLNSICPNELRVMDPQNNVVACKSACEAFGKPEYCCTGAYSTPETCPPTNYSKTFKKACPSAYSYAYDDATSTFTCSRSNYLITFCP